MNPGDHINSCDNRRPGEDQYATMGYHHVYEQNATATVAIPRMTISTSRLYAITGVVSYNLLASAATVSAASSLSLCEDHTKVDRSKKNNWYREQAKGRDKRWAR